MTFEVNPVLKPQNPFSKCRIGGFIIQVIIQFLHISGAIC